MVAKLAINGFGRVGRMCLRASLQNPEVEVVAINGTSSSHSLAHLLKYDSVHGKINAEVETTDDALIINGRPIKVLSDRNINNLHWNQMDIDIVLESTGKFRSRKDAEIHLHNGAKKVIITAPAEDEDITVVMGVNEESYLNEKHHIISNASCTTNCLAPVAKVIHDTIGIETGIVTTIHAFTSDQRSLDNSHKDLRRARSCVQSIVPTTTGAARAVGLVIPELNGKLNGISMRVPVPNVSIVDLVVQLKQDATAEELNAVLKEASEGYLNGILEYCNEPLVSIDFLGNSSSAIVDGLSTMVVEPRCAKILAWYDNEWGYSCRVIDLAAFVGRQLNQKILSDRIAG